jgi:hypothetical protein
MTGLGRDVVLLVTITYVVRKFVTSASRYETHLDGVRTDFFFFFVQKNIYKQINLITIFTHIYIYIYKIVFQFKNKYIPQNILIKPII